MNRLAFRTAVVMIPTIMLSGAAQSSCVSKPMVAKKNDGTLEPTKDNQNASQPMITKNPDGTFTIQKEPRKDSQNAKTRQGLVIPPQVVVPLARIPEKKPDNR